MAEHGVTDRLADDPDHVSFARSRVVVIAGPDLGSEAEARGDELSIGTAPGNDLVLTDRTVSRHHVSIRLSPQRALLRDLGSTNGTRIGELGIHEVSVRPGTRFVIGNTTIELAEPHGIVRESLSADRSFAGMLGHSVAMRRLFDMLPRVAAASTSVLLTGETGTGKSLLARAIHDASPRRDAPFVVVDCGAVPPTLIESELFGHVKGAFTGATRDREGAFRAAAGGTVFLDEIGELSLELQPKLLRALEERVVTPVGADRDVALDIRLLAASNRDLRERVNAGRFRGDLYYRLDVVSLRVPPLRERRDDIEQLVDHFHRQLAEGRPAPPALVAACAQRDWPGNVRELRAAVERAVVLGELDDDSRDAIAGTGALDIDPDLSFRAAKEVAIARWETGFLTALIERNHGNLTHAAREARMDRNYLRELLARRGISTK